MDLSILKTLAEQGVLAIVLALSIGANYFFVKGWLKEKDKRVQDAQNVSDKVLVPIETLQKTLDNMQTLLQVIVKK